MLFKTRAVRITGFLRIHVDLATRFSVHEKLRFLKREIEFCGIEDLEQAEFISTGTEITEILLQFVQRTKKIRDNNEQPPFANSLSSFADCRSDSRRFALRLM